MSLAACGEANDTELVTTRTGGSKNVQDKGVASCAATPDDIDPRCGPRKRRMQVFVGIPASFQDFYAIGQVASNMRGWCLV